MTRRGLQLPTLRTYPGATVAFPNGWPWPALRRDPGSARGTERTRLALE